MTHILVVTENCLFSLRFPLISHLNRVRSGYEFIFPLYLNPWNRLNGKLMILIPLFTVFHNRGPSTYTPCGRSLFTWSFNLRYQADTAKNKMDRCPRSEKNSLPYQPLCHPLRRYCIFQRFHGDKTKRKQSTSKMANRDA